MGSEETGQQYSRRGMEGGSRQSKLLGRLLSRLRGDHHRHSYNIIDKRYSLTSCAERGSFVNIPSLSESTGRGSTVEDEDMMDPVVGQSKAPPVPSAMSAKVSAEPSTAIDDHEFAANIDLRYGGQYLTPEQLPEFCEQLHHLVEVIRNIQSYAKVTGEYPSDLERRLEQEAREVAALAGEARNAREVLGRVRAQREAVRVHHNHLLAHLATLRDSETRELESTVRSSDRKLYKSWEVLKDSTNPAAFDSLLDEVKNKQAALECLVRLIEGRCGALQRSAAAPTLTPLPPPESKDTDRDGNERFAGRKRPEARRAGTKRRRREPRSAPLSGEPSHHAAPAAPAAPASPQPQVTLYIQGTESAPRYRVNSAGTVALTPLELPSGGSVRDILFFSAN